MNENVIEFISNEKTAGITFSQQKYITKIRKLAASHPDECKILAENSDGSIFAHVPTSWIKVSPPKQMNISEERRQQMVDNLRKVRENKTYEN